MTQAFFITGTDTGVGKTHVACQLIRQYIAQGLKVVGMKPIAAGCESIDGQWVNEDVAKLMAASNVKAPFELVNPYSFDAPVAPHLAAEEADIEIKIEKIQEAFNQLKTMADVVIVEGAGGFLVPLNNTETLADLAAALDIPVILVVGMKLGCINHSLLTVEAIRTRQLSLHGWVANHIDSDMVLLKENVQTIAEQLGSPSLFEFNWTT